MSILDDDKRYCWHPFTQHQTERDAEVIVRAKGVCLYDEASREILDLISSWWCCIHGHSHPKLNAALIDQAEALEHVMYGGFTHAPAVNLAKKIAALLPGDLNRVFFSDSGSAAVEVALKMAYQYWKNKGETGRRKFLSFDRSYHGDTFGAMAVGKASGFYAAFEDLLFTVDMLPFPDTWEGDETVEAREAKAMGALQAQIKNSGQEIAALIIEPIMQGAGGMRFCRPSFMRQVTEAAQEAGILVIYDEIAVGFGRLGTMFAAEKICSTPDIICLSKGLTAGYLPMALTVASDRIFEEFLGSGFEKALAHGHTFTANPLACAVANASLDLFEEEQSLERVAWMEAQHKKQIPALLAHPQVTRPRVMGSVLAFDLVSELGRYKTDGGEALRDWYLDNGLNIRPLGSSVYLMPPYCITEEQLARAYDGLFAGLDNMSLQATARSAAI